MSDAQRRLLLEAAGISKRFGAIRALTAIFSEQDFSKG